MAQIEHPSRAFRCCACNRFFSRLEHLKRHWRIHTGDKPHSCQYPTCSKRFSRADELKRHIRVHDRPVPETSRERASTLCTRHARQPFNEPWSNVPSSESPHVSPGAPFRGAYHAACTIEVQFSLSTERDQHQGDLKPFDHYYARCQEKQDDPADYQPQLFNPVLPSSPEPCSNTQFKPTRYCSSRYQNRPSQTTNPAASQHSISGDSTSIAHPVEPSIDWHQPGQVQRRPASGPSKLSITNLLDGGDGSTRRLPVPVRMPAALPPVGSFANLPPEIQAVDMRSVHGRQGHDIVEDASRLLVR